MIITSKLLVVPVHSSDCHKCENVSSDHETQLRFSDDEFFPAQILQFSRKLTLICTSTNTEGFFTVLFSPPHYPIYSIFAVGPFPQFRVPHSEGEINFVIREVKFPICLLSCCLSCSGAQPVKNECPSNI